MSITHIASARTYPTEADARCVLAERVSEALDAPYLGIWASPPDDRIPVALHVFGADDIPGRMAADGWRRLETPCWCSFLGEGMPVHERSGLCLPDSAPNPAPAECPGDGCAGCNACQSAPDRATDQDETASGS